MLGQTQGRGCASTEARLPALSVRSSVLTCTGAVRCEPTVGQGADRGPDSWRPSLFDDCPMCAKAPVEPVRVEGVWACRGCTGSCTICGSACFPGDEACAECERHLCLEAVPA